MEKKNSLLFYQGAAIFYGVVVTIQKVLNAGLSAAYGQWGSTTIVHLVGLICLMPMVLLGKSHKEAKAPWYFYLGGVIGVLNVIFSNIGFQALGVTQSLVFVLIGQILCSSILDFLGAFGVEKQKVSSRTITAIVIMLMGCFTMILIAKERIDFTKGFAMLCSFVCGSTLATSRGFNRLLTVRSGKNYSTVMNFVTGLVTSFAVLALTGFKMSNPLFSVDLKWIYYIGGFFGFLGIFFCNTASVGLSALDLSVLLFVGQSVTGVIIDSFARTFTLSTFVGAVIVFAGFLYNLKSK